MKITIDLKYFIPALIAFALAEMTLTYEIDKYITFAGEANAMAFFMITAVTGCLLAYCSFSK